MNKLIDGRPMVLVEDGRSPRAALGTSTIAQRPYAQGAASGRRHLDGCTPIARALRIDQIKYAVLEGSGGISIIPKQES